MHHRIRKPLLRAPARLGKLGGRICVRPFSSPLADGTLPFRAAHLLGELGARLGRHLQQPQQECVAALVVGLLVAHERRYSMARQRRKPPKPPDQDPTPRFRKRRTMKNQPQAIVLFPEDIPAPTRENLYQALGQAISAWQFVEKALSGVFLKLLCAKNDDIGLAVFYSPRDFSEKLKTTHLIARIALSGNLFEEWANLRKRLIDEAETRNCMAHFGYHTYFVEHYPTEGSRVRVSTIDYMLVPNTQDPQERLKKRNKPSQTPLDAYALFAAYEHFMALISDLNNFSQKIPPQP